MSKGRLRDEDKARQWRERIREWRTSGTSVRAYCQWIGVSEPTFYCWRRECDRCAADTSAFVPVHVILDRLPAKEGQLEIVLAGGRCVRVAPGFDAATLRQLLAVLEEPC
ncbi:MAG TPA: hypothetical protein VK395_28685 [Gemmataceae bacterium]|nr:hypothetical protein [Gemmataceae bacterium]